MRMSGYELELIVKHQAMQLQMTDLVSRLGAHPFSTPTLASHARLPLPRLLLAYTCPFCTPHEVLRFCLRAGA